MRKAAEARGCVLGESGPLASSASMSSSSRRAWRAAHGGYDLASAINLRPATRLAAANLHSLVDPSGLLTVELAGLAGGHSDPYVHGVTASQLVYTPLLSPGA